MRAAVYRRHGPPEVVRIENVPVPVPKSTEVLVRVRAATVSAADWRLRSAAPFPIRIFNGLWRPTKINILGMEFSGVVESVGNVVTRFAPRLRVDRSPARHEILDQLAGLGLLQFSSDAHGMALQQVSDFSRDHRERAASMKFYQVVVWLRLGFELF